MDLPIHHPPPPPPPAVPDAPELPWCPYCGEHYRYSFWHTLIHLVFSGRIVGWALAAVLVGFGLFHLFNQEAAIRLWTPMQAEVIVCQPRYLKKVASEFSQRYAVDLRYRYTVDGEVYEATRVTTGEPKLFYFREDAEKYCNQFPAGSSIEIRYASYAPSQATMLAERGSGTWILLALGLPVLGVMVLTRGR